MMLTLKLPPERQDEKGDAGGAEELLDGGDKLG
jgi:hypothetical protein